VTPTHYHLKLYYSRARLRDIERVYDRETAMERARHYTGQVQQRLGSEAFQVRAEPCSLLHFPDRHKPV
jgi:hypothetical protein